MSDASPATPQGTAARVKRPGLGKQASRRVQTADPHARTPSPPPTPQNRSNQNGPGSLPGGEQPLTLEELAELERLSRVPSPEVMATLHDTMCRSSPIYFAASMLTGPAEYDGKFIVAQHHEAWNEIVLTHRKACIEAPRDHGKSIFFSFAYPLWRMYYARPKLKGILFSNTKPQAIEMLGRIKDEIENNPKLRWLKPARERNWSNTKIRCSNGAELWARGFGTKVRGAHPDFAIVDDGLNDEAMYSDIVRKKQKEFFFSVVVNMVVPGGQIIVVGTPFHEADLYGELETNPAYHFRRFPARNEDGSALWPGRYNDALLSAKKLEIGTIRFAREFMCQAVNDDMSIFPSTLFQGEPTEQPLVKLRLSPEFYQKRDIKIYMGVDIALSANVKADWFVIWTMGVDKRGNRWIIDIDRHHGLPFHRQKSRILELGRLYQPEMIGIESNQMQAVWGNELIRLTDLPIKKLVTGKEKHSLEDGVPGLRTLLENNKYRIPRGDRRSVELTNIWKREMAAFTYVDGKLEGLGEHDDTVMACWLCERLIAKGGHTVFGEDEDLQGDVIAELTGESAKPREMPLDPDAPLPVDGEPDPRVDGVSDDPTLHSEYEEPVEELDLFGFPVTRTPQVPSPLEGFGLPSR